MPNINQMGFGPKTSAFPSVPIHLQAGAAYILPSGQYMVYPGSLTFIQWYDPVTTMWRNLTTPVNSDSNIISSDGTNYRLVNATGTVVGASVTTTGSAGTNGIYYPAGFPIAGSTANVAQQAGTATAPSVTFAAGGGSVLAQANIIIGGAVATTSPTVTGGSGYNRPPTVLVSPPPVGGIPCTVTATVSGGAITSATVTNQGAGYTSTPTCTIVPHPADTSAQGGAIVLSATLAASGGVTGIVVVSGGVGHTSVPAVTITGLSGSPAATAIMCFTATTVTWAGATNMGNGNFGLIGSALVTSPTLTNPAITTGLFVPRLGYTAFSTTAGPTTTTILDGGLHQTAPNAVTVFNPGAAFSGATTTTIAQGGATDTSYIVPI